MEGPNRPTLISSVRRALRLLEAAASHDNGAPAKQLAREAGLSLSTAYHLLRTLLHDGYLRRTPEGRYVLGDRVEALRETGRMHSLVRRVHPVLVALRDELQVAAYLALYLDGEIRVVDIADGPRTPRVDLWVGCEDSGHATALGKCVLRQLDPDGRRDYLSRHELHALTPNTVTRVDELLRRLDEPCGLTVELEEYAVGTACAAVPVGDGAGPGALAVSFRPSELPRVRESADRLRAAAERVSRTLLLSR
ncbi:IclR family transcriptional regulator [Bailinhaonella thermotolerans]|uniref:Glycerol operon regulatory protein n=1 Tax=Bailinhaonella thermotolerans TaxID=1070861 RepID=A0A3A4B9C8_9ACTN|nr:IclR family transcriptional regulator C-terminal domain-containing protein [Bailinhaonella thermotolerans]RJL30768.1 IclR family transcriptional regulator [Bailinhaonella thermotolerans]